MDTIKTQINNLKDYAELAQASYFNFIYVNGQKTNNYQIGQDRFYKDKEKVESLEYIKTLSKKYEGYFIYDDSIAFYPKLNGEFGEIQARNFANKVGA